MLGLHFNQYETNVIHIGYTHSQTFREIETAAVTMGFPTKIAALTFLNNAGYPKAQHDGGDIKAAMYISINNNTTWYGNKHSSYNYAKHNKHLLCIVCLGTLFKANI